MNVKIKETAKQIWDRCTDESNPMIETTRTY